MVFFPINHRKKLIQQLKNVLPKNSDVALAYSGGADSTYALHALNSLKEELNINLLAFHVDHKVRKTSTREAKWLATQAAHLNIPYHILSIEWRDHKDVREEVLRDLRWEKLFEACQSRNIKTLITAHHANDQLETVLKRCLEGASLLNLRGIELTSKRNGMTILRPFLDVSKEEMLKTLKSSQIPFIEDETNQDIQFLRARMRKETIPFIEKSFGKNIMGSMLRISEEASELRSYFLRVHSKYLAKATDRSLNLRTLCPEEPVEMYYLLKEFLANRQITLSRLNLKILVQLMMDNASKKQIVQGRHVIFIDKRELTIT